MLFNIVSTYFILGLLSNLIGPVSRRIKEEFAKTDLKMGMYSVGAPELYEKMKGQEIPIKIVFRLLVTVFWPVFYLIVSFDYWREKKRACATSRITKSPKHRNTRYFSF